MKVKTSKLKEASRKVSKLVGSNSVMEICNYLEVIYTGNQIVLTATDKTRAITASIDVEEQEDSEFSVVIEGQKFISLVRNTTTGEITLTPKDSHFELKGNGKYKLSYYTEEFFDYSVDPDIVLDLDAEELINIIDRHEDTVSKEIDVMSGYYLDNENLITLDGQKMALTEHDLFEEELSLLIPEEVATLIPLFEKEGNIQLMLEDRKLLFFTNDLTIFGGQLFGIDEFPDISNFIGKKYKNWGTIKRSLLEGALSRIELFVEEESDYAIYLKLKDGELEIKDCKESSVESVDVVDSEGEFEVYLTLPHIKLFLKNLGTYKVRLGYEEGEPAVRISNEDITTNYFSAIVLEQ